MNYKFSGSTQLTAHFNVQEFRCKCGKNHDIQLNSELPEKLESLFGSLNCSKIIVNSGHRCPEHDRAVGGSGTGQHVDGNAADIVCYDKSGRVISSKIVCCAAQDLNFGGIANIDSSYTATHLDVRTGNFWKGDETVTTSYSVTSDFYSYFGLDKNAVYSSVNSVRQGIDVSEHQGVINWNRVQTDFCIIRAGYGREISQKDKCFDANYNGCKAHDIPCGVYWYSYAVTAEDARKEAQACLQVISGRKFEYPIYFDVEEYRQFRLGKSAVSEIIRAFCEVLENAGYWVGLYMSASHLNNYVDDDIKQNYALWVANYGVSAPSCSGTYGIWQHSSTGRIAGISTDIDLNYCCFDYPSQIRKAALNGYAESQPPTVPAAPESVRVSVELNGKLYQGELSEK